MKAKLLLLVLLPFLFLNISAQKREGKFTIKGTVVDVSGLPIRNAMIVVDGQKTNSKTNNEGEYSVRVRANAEMIAVVTFGSGMKGELIQGRKEINFKFDTYAANADNRLNPGEEGVNTGYASIKKKDLTTQVDKIDGTKSKYASYHNVYEMIERECAGVKIGGSGIIIQDSRNLQGNVPALLVVDGVYVDDLSNISPASVESIQVLKGTSAAIYGSRGYGGAVVIKTKMKNY